MRKMNDSAQWQLIEVVLVAGILFAATYLVRSSNITVYKSIEEENPLKAQGYDALESLASQTRGVPGGYRTLLEYYVIENPGTNPGDDFKAAIKEFFPSSDVNFKIERVDITYLKNHQNAVPADYVTPLVDSVYWVDEKSCTVTRVVEHNSNVYKVVLYLWYNT